MKVYVEIENYIKQLNDDIKMFRNASLSYVKTLTGEDKFLLICCEGENKLDRISSDVCDDYEISSPCKSLDITGSPLKDNCQLADVGENSVTRTKYKTNLQREQEKKFIPIHVNKARSIISYLSANKFGKHGRGSVWVLCDGSDSRKTILLRLKFSSIFNQRTVVYYRGVIVADDLKMSEMMSLHAREISRVKVDTTVECTINVSPYAVLRVIWNSSSPDPPLNNFKNSDITLLQTMQVGNPYTALEDLWSQLVALYTLKNYILDYNTTSSNDEPLYCGEQQMDLECIRGKILSILTDISEFQEEELNVGNFEIETIVRNVKHRSDLDVTDQLWEVLRCCCNYHDLKSAINVVFFCAAKCNIVNVPTNQNRLAELIREISQRRLAVPCLSGTEPLELLLETGLEKIFKDYEHIFSVSKICSSNQLNSNSTVDNLEKNARKSLYSLHVNNVSLKNTSIFGEEHNRTVEGFQNSKFDRNVVESKLSRLIQIHLTLEHLLAIQVHLNLQNVYGAITEQMLRKPLRPFENVLCSSIDKIEIPVTIDDVFGILKHKIPQTRKITMFSKNNVKEVQTTFYFSEENIFPLEIFPIDDKEFAKRNTYYCWHCVDIKTKSHKFLL